MRAALASIAVCVVCAAVSCAPPAEKPADKPFAVVDGFIRDAQGRAVILRGVNESGLDKNAPYLVPTVDADFVTIHDDMGMNAVRFLLEWAAVEPTRGTFDDDYLDAVRARMDAAKDAGLLVVLDMHQDLFGEGFAGGDGAPRWACDDAHYAAYQPSDQWFLGYLDKNVVACFDGLWNDDGLADAYAAAWRHVAARLHDHAAVIGFEVMNEPWLGSYGLDEFEPQALQPFYERVVPQVRAEAPQWLAFLEPSSMSNLGQGSKLTPLPFDDVVYAPHSYDNAAERGEPFDADHRDQVLTKLTTLADEARGLNAALWIGEYGGDANNPGITPYMDAEYDAFASVLAGSSYWDFSRGDGYGVLNDDGSEKPVLWDVLVRPALDRIAGTPTSWAYDDATRILSASWTATSDAASTLRVPQRAYPSGFDVDVTGGSARVDGDVVAIVGSGDVSVRITPHALPRPRQRDAR